MDDAGHDWLDAGREGAKSLWRCSRCGCRCSTGGSRPRPNRLVIPPWDHRTDFVERLTCLEAVLAGVHDT